MQSFFIGIGAIVASALPWMMANWFDVSNTAAAGQVPDTVKWSFYLGGLVFLGAVLWTVLRSREYSPRELAAFEEPGAGNDRPEADRDRSAGAYRNGGLAWLGAGAVFFMLVAYFGLDKQLFILAAGAALFGLLQVIAGRMQASGQTSNGLYEVVEDLFHMPRVMRQLAWVQFCAWFALFAMWIYTTAAVTAFHYGAIDASGDAYNEGANWVGVLFASYNGFAALAALVIPVMARKLGCRLTHLVNLSIGGLALVSFLFIRDPAWLLLPMVGVGIAWASILSVPYALLAGVLPARKMGVYMGIFNFFIVIPQLIAASVLGLIIREFFAGEAIYGLVTGGVLMIVAGLVTLRVDREAEPDSERVAI
jgi:maltose/moltooligosaccharide transporter